MPGRARGTGQLPRREARLRAVELLYECDVRRVEPDTVLKSHEGASLDDFALSLVRGVWESREDLDELIDRHARGWSVARMAVVDRNILRLAVFELTQHQETPPAVVIDEAVELAKMMSGDEAPRFVNGVLAAVHRALQSGAR